MMMIRLVRVALAAALVVAGLGFTARPALAAGCDTPGQPTTTVYLPNITKTLGGPNGWVTPFIVQNVGTAATTLEVSFYRFSDGTLVTCRKVTGLLPYTSFADVPNNDADLPADTQFAVVVRSFGAQVVAVVNEHQNELVPGRAEALSYTGLSTGAMTVYLPFVGKPEAAPCTAPQPSEFLCNLRWVTTFIMQNLGTVDATITARFASYDGATTATLTRTVAPGRSKFIDPSAEPTLQAGRYYAVTLSATQPIAVVANAHDDAPTTTSPRAFSYNGVPQPVSGETFLPYVRRDGGGVRLIPGGVIVQNAGPSDATPTLLFQRLNGGASVSIVAPAPIRPGAAWYFDPEVFAIVGGYQLCANAGPGRCIDPGEHSLTVTGGAFAVLGTTSATGAAMGYTGTTGQGNRAFVPNVTRTLGGPSGWTTPIVLQSTGATGATLRWYRFSDGALMQRQTIALPARGVAVRVDPRAVAGLVDNTQYAVVVDAQNGSVAVVVTELNFNGGDGTMAYEGFPATVDSAPQPTVLSVAPSSATVTAGGTAQFTVTVKDQFDNTLFFPVSWALSPPTLGTISSAGLFTASASVAGAGTVTAGAGSVVGTTQITVVPPQLATVGGINFRVDSSGPGDVDTELTITSADTATIVAQAAVDVAAIQTDYGRAFTRRPTLYVMASTASYTTALQTIFGFGSSTAQQAGANTQGIFGEGPNATASDWAKLQPQKPLSSLRHELTHMMEAQISRGADIPAWFNEGTARLEDLTVPGSQYKVVLNRYGAASMASLGALIPLTDLVSQQSWNLRPLPLGSYQYYEASQAVQLIRGDVGAAGIIRILDLMGQGQTFDAAYTTTTGQPFATYLSTYAARIRAIAPFYPGIQTAGDSIAGPGLSFMLYGFTANAQVTVNISGAASATPQTVTTSSIGTYMNYLDDQWPAGSYTFSATWSGGTVSTTAVKTASSQGVGAVGVEPGTMMLALPREPQLFGE
jgi:hypothetical protein